MVGVGGIAAIVCVAGVAGAWMRVLPAMVGFGAFALGGLAAVVVAVATLVRLVRGGAPTVGQVAAVVVAVVFVGAALPGLGLPRINDFTTNPADPPAFVHAPTLPANAGREFAYPPAFAAHQRTCCPDLRGSLLDGEPGVVVARALAIARSMSGWEVTFEDGGAGIVEAVATTRVFGFHDDVVIRIRPAAGGGSRVDVRSKSRDGRGDMGANAARIRAFIAALEADG